MSTLADAVPKVRSTNWRLRLRLWLLTKDNALKVAVIVAYATVVLAGATTSSIGMPHLREDPSHPIGTQFGDSRGVRSDEYNAYTPIALSVMATGGAPTLSELGAPADLVHRFSSGGFFESIVFFDSALLKTAVFLPDAMVFAAYWWLPSLLLFLFMPKWFGQLGASRRWGWLAAGLIALSPCVAWWSMMPIALLAYTLTGSSLMLSAYRRFNEGKRLLASAQVFVGGVLIAGIPSFYTPWSLLLGVPVLVASTLWILTRSDKLWAKIRPVLLTGIVAAVLGLGTLMENSAGLQALLGTVYPGARRSSAIAQPYSLLFGAPFLSPLQDGVDPAMTNASELATSFTVCFVWALVLVAAAKFSQKWRDHVATGTILGFGLIWLGWALVNTGSFGEKVPLLNFVTPVRAAQVVGILGVISVCLLLSTVQVAPGWRIAIVAGGSVGLVTAYGGAQLQQSFLPGIHSSAVLLTSVVVGLVTVLLTRFPGRIAPMVVVLVVAAIPVYKANPLIIGLGDFRNSSTAKMLYSSGQEARQNKTVWASDFGAFDTIMLANGVPTLSGLQRSGPNKSVWKKLDPSNQFEEAWNRGGGYVPFSWRPGGKTEITTNGFDVTFVALDPCTLAATVTNVSHIVSTVPLSEPCLSFNKVVTWAGKQLSIYTVR